MKEWWNNLAVREKQTLLAGSILVMIFVVYTFIWTPLAESIQLQREKIQSNQALLAWMQQADQQLQHPQSQTLRAKKTYTGSLLSFIQSQINKTELETLLTELKQSENDTVQLRFKEVNFDKLIIWLVTLAQDYHLSVVRMAVTPTTTIGIVNADIVIGPG